MRPISALSCFVMTRASNEAVLARILKEQKGKIVLVVAHSNTVPTLIADLGASKNVPPIDENEYDNIYLVSIPWFGKTKTIRLRFGEPYLAPTLIDGERTISDTSRMSEERT